MRTLASNSSTFQAACGVASAAAALAFIFIGANHPSEEDSELTRPFLLIHRPSSGARRAVRTNAASAGGEMRLLLEKTISEAYQPDAEEDNAQLEMENFVGNFINDCMSLSATPGYLLIREMEIVEGPFRYEAESIKNVMGCWITVRYGLTG